jgi:outer membrane protein assembly factor BamB
MSASAASRTAGAGPSVGAASRTAGAGPGASAARIPDGDWTMFDFNPQRSGVGPAQTGITRGNLDRLRARVVSLPGTVDASAIQLHGVRVRGRRRDVIVLTTSYGRTLAIDPGSGRLLWQFAPRHIGSYQGGPQITQATPVADPDRRHVYSLSPDGYAHKLNLANGRAVWATRVTWDPTREKVDQLNLSGRWLIVTTGGYDGDAPTYQGHVALIDRATGHLAHVWNSLCSHRRGLIHPPSSCSSSDSAIWGRAGAVVEPGTGRILVATGNGPFNGSSNWGDSTLELSPTLRPLRHWTPTNEQQLFESDTDVGSTSPALLPGGLAVQGGKQGILSLLRLDRLPAMNGAAGHRLGGQLQNIATPGGAQVFSAPAVWGHSGRTYLFLGTSGGTAAYVLGSNRRLRVAWSDDFAGTSPVLAGGLLYVYDESDGVLKVLSPTSGRTLRSLPAAGGHWNSPIVVGGRIILPVGNADDQQTTGQLYIFHLPGR